LSNSKYISDALIQALVQGDRHAQVEVYNRYYHAMYNTAYRIVKDEWEAEDLMQESFIDAFEKIDSFQGRATFGSWLKRIVINKCLNFLKKRRIDLVDIDDQHWESIPEQREAKVRPLQVSREVILESINQLADGYRVILTLYLIEGYDHGEIADIMGIGKSTSRSQFNRARNKLKDILADKLGEETLSTLTKSKKNERPNIQSNIRTQGKAGSSRAASGAS
jgi:RNA polymerase sigma factor (sigma-70 family)